MSTIIYNDNGDIIGEIFKSKNSKGIWFSALFDAKGERVIESFYGKIHAINFLKKLNINQVSDEELALSILKDLLNKIDITPAQHLKIAEALSIKDEIYLDCIKKLLAPMIQEAVKEDQQRAMMTKDQIEQWFKKMMERVVLNAENNQEGFKKY